MRDRNNNKPNPNPVCPYPNSFYLRAAQGTRVLPTQPHGDARSVVLVAARAGQHRDDLPVHEVGQTHHAHRVLVHTTAATHVATTGDVVVVVGLVVVD